MKLDIFYFNSFKKEIKIIRKRGKNLNKLEEITFILISGGKLPSKYKEHKLKGNFSGYWEYHIEPDWLLIYKKTKNSIIFARTGSHSDLF